MTFGEDVAVKMSQRTLILILGMVLALGGVWMDLKRDARENRTAIAALSADHDVIVRLAVGIEQLQKQSDRRERADARADRAAHP